MYEEAYQVMTLSAIRCDHLFGPVEKRWIDEYFPFTEPSFELEIFYNGDWMEVLGCGVIHSGVLSNVGIANHLTGRGSAVDISIYI